MLTFLLLISIAVVVFGFRGVQRTGNYENKWGYMFWYGLPIFFILALLRLIL